MFEKTILRSLSALMAVTLWASSGGATELYVGPNGRGIFRLDLDSPNTAVEIVPKNLVNTSTGIEVSYGERKVYWIADTQLGSVDKIRRSNLDGSNVELFLTPAGQPADIEIDPYLGRLYYTERITNSINVVALQGGDPVQLVSTQEPRGMDLDLVNGFLYWVEVFSNRLLRSRLDGTEVQDVITSGMTRPFDVTVDPLHERLYWVELGSSRFEGRVWTAGLDGTNPFLIADQQSQPTDLVVDWAEGYIYWGTDSLLYRADLDGTNVRKVGTNLPGHRNLALDIVTPVPEPGAHMLAGIALLGLAVSRWRQCCVPGRKRP